MEIELPDDFKEFLKLLNEHGVEYLLIGGYAVGYYGYPRATNDLDIKNAIGDLPMALVLNLVVVPITSREACEGSGIF